MNEEMRKALSLEFKNADGEIVPELSCCPANIEHIHAAVMFLGTGNSFTVSVVDFALSGAK